jgi:hypothetical protein
MIAEAAQIDSGDPIAGAYGTINFAHKARGSHPRSNLPQNRLGVSQGARGKGGSHDRQAGLEATCVGGGQGMARVLEWLS